MSDSFLKALQTRISRKLHRRCLTGSYRAKHLWWSFLRKSWMAFSLKLFLEKRSVIIDVCLLNTLLHSQNCRITLFLARVDNLSVIINTHFCTRVNFTTKKRLNPTIKIVTDYKLFETGMPRSKNSHICFSK